MKKPRGSSVSSSRVRAAIAATVLAIPVVGLVPSAHAQPQKAGPDHGRKKPKPELRSIELKEKCCYSVAGILAERIVYTNRRGEFFSVDSATGDLRFYTKEQVTKLRVIEGVQKTQTALRFLGRNEEGEVVHQNERGEKFTINRRTGDMVFVK